jgi:hypothetical protein
MAIFSLLKRPAPTGASTETKSQDQNETEGVLKDLYWQVVADVELLEEVQQSEAQSHIGNFKLETGSEPEPPDVGCYKGKG